MTPLEIKKNREIFLDYCRKYIQRDGLEKLLTYIESTDFFTAPSSTKFHLNTPGGLCKHCINVFETAMQINEHILLPRQQREESIFPQPLSTESIAIVALFHDVCKCNIYKEVDRWRKNDAGKWETYKGYEVNDEFPFGHGEKSCHMVNYYLRLKRDELLAIRWHMGMFDVGESGSANRFSFYSAMEITPLVVLMQMADMASSHWFEQTFSPGGDI